jgi:hypothetical protein
MDISKVEQAVVTLYEGHYHFGVASLLNSLVDANFKGLFRIGYRKELPYWTNQLKKISGSYFILNEIIIDFVEIESKMHFGYYKPTFLLNTLKEYESLNDVYYFDPDIIVSAPWVFFSDWVKAGVALCLDNCFYYLHYNHPWRKEWMRLAEVSDNFKCKIDFYVNSGFIGLNKSNISILEKWIALTEKYKQIGGDVSRFEKEGHRAFKGDQDLLNAVMTADSYTEFSIIGREGMGFTQPAYLMTHAVAAVKPWKKNYFMHLIKRGKRPDLADMAYMNYANTSIKPFSNVEFLIKQINLKISLVLGRVIG